MIFYLQHSYEEIFILNEAKISLKKMSLRPVTCEAIEKTCILNRLYENQTLEELSTYGELVSYWHEGSPDWAFAPPN